MRYFYYEDYIFELTTPDYEVPVFGHKVGELRLKNKNYITNDMKKALPLQNITEHLINNKIVFCTFRGKEDLNVIRLLNAEGFKFVSTFNTVRCTKDNFKEIKLSSDLETCVLSQTDFEEILTLEGKVFDYSTFQIDPLIDRHLAAHRNVIRVKSYFNNSKHKTYIVKVCDKIAGFLQFIVDIHNGVADCVNGAVDPDFQGLFIGPKLYSDAFKRVFDLGAFAITGGYSTQNVAVSKLFAAYNFQIIDHEIHLRLNINH